VKHKPNNSIAALLRFRTPVTIIHGDRNPIVPLKCAHSFYNQYFEFGEVVKFVGADHDIPLLNALDLAKVINKELV
jgi:hypothetical protein